MVVDSYSTAVNLCTVFHADTAAHNSAQLQGVQQYITLPARVTAHARADTMNHCRCRELRSLLLVRQIVAIMTIFDLAIAVAIVPLSISNSDTAPNSGTTWSCP